MSNRPPKIVIVGAGSLFFGRQAIWALTNQPGFKGATVVLVDTDEECLGKLTRLAEMAAETSESGVQIQATKDYRKAFPGADFIILSFSKDNTHYRRIDCEISAKYGIRMCSGDTIGPGGVFRTIREFPMILEIAEAAADICPDAWLINYVNPSAVMGIGLMRHSRVKSFALCDTHHMPHKKESYADLLGLSEEERKNFDIRIAGVNHFTWMLSAEVSGRDVLPELREAFRAQSLGEKDEGYAKARFNNFITAQLADVFGAIPTCTGHTKEYLPYYQGRSGVQEAIPPLSVFDCDERDERKARMWIEVDEYLSGTKPMSEFHANGKADHATDVIHTMLVEDGRTFYINRTNDKCTAGGERPVENLPADSFLELLCVLDKNGPRPMPAAPFPLGLRSLQMSILDIHELTIEAIMKKDRALLVRALAMDPLVNSIATADTVISELYAAESEALPAWLGDKQIKTTSASAKADRNLVPQLY